MPHNEPSLGTPPRWHPGAPEAQRLAEALRGVRLSLLIGAPGAGKTALLASGVLPLLRRRAIDAAAHLPRAPSQVILPFPERRSQARAKLAELVIHVDGWAEAPLGRLHDAVDAAMLGAGLQPETRRKALVERVQASSQQFGTQFLFVLDRFEELLDKPAGDAGRELALDQLVQLLNRRLQANVLIAMRSDAGERFALFCDRLYGIDDAEVLHLPEAVPAPPARPAPHLRAVAAAPTPLPATDPPVALDLPRAPIEPGAASATAMRSEDIYAAIETTLARTCVEPVSAASASAAPAALRQVAVPAPRPAATEGELPPRTQPPRHDTPAWKHSTPWRRSTLVLAALALAIVAAGVLWNSTRPVLPPATQAALAAGVAPAAAMPVAPAPTLTTPHVPATRPATALLAPLPAMDLLVEDEGDAAPRLPTELARALAVEGGIDLHVQRTAGGAAALLGGARPRLALVRYDALQAAARGTGPRPALAVVAPLYTEEIVVVVRADSPLRFIHQIEGRRINAGPAKTGRALTAATLYRRMFGKPLPTTGDSALAAPVALQRLATGTGLDAVLLVAPHPATWLTALPVETRHRLRSLALDLDHPASRKALQTYLPATLRDPSDVAGAPGTTPTLAAMSFLVTIGTPGAADDAALGRLARSLCSTLPALQRGGDTKWREVQPGLELETAWPTAAATSAAWRVCGAAEVPSPAIVRSPVPKPAN